MTQSQRSARGNARRSARLRRHAKMIEQLRARVEARVRVFTPEEIAAYVKARALQRWDGGES